MRSHLCSKEELSKHDSKDEDDEGCINVGGGQNFVTWSNLNTPTLCLTGSKFIILIYMNAM